jgi:metal-sulfur cluster biosynthetic enzyme
MSKEQVIEALKQVNDPELNIDVWTLGLIYEVQVENNIAAIKMTFTSPMCPYGPMLVESIKNKVSELQEINDTEIEVTFEPPWKPSDELRETLGV